MGRTSPDGPLCPSPKPSLTALSSCAAPRLCTTCPTATHSHLHPWWDPWGVPASLQGSATAAPPAQQSLSQRRGPSAPVSALPRGVPRAPLPTGRVLQPLSPARQRAAVRDAFPRQQEAAGTGMRSGEGWGERAGDSRAGHGSGCLGLMSPHLQTCPSTPSALWVLPELCYPRSGGVSPSPTLWRRWSRCDRAAAARATAPRDGGWHLPQLPRACPCHRARDGAAQPRDSPPGHGR